MDIIIRNISDLYTFDQERRRERGVDLRIVDGEIREIGHGVSPVSYTHLTLPTIYSV